MTIFKKSLAKTNQKVKGYLFLCATLVTCLAYLFVDKPLALWIYNHPIQKNTLIVGVTYLPNLFVYLSVATVFGIFICSQLTISKLKQAKLPAVIITIAFSAYLAVVLTKALKFIFGRIGPTHWISQHFNPDSYGFFPFHGYLATYQDFPSGHATTAFAIVSVMYWAYPKFRWAYLLVGLCIIVSLLFTQSHFLADCLAGIVLGSIIGYLTARFFELTRP